MHKLKIIQIGKSLGIVLPADALSALKWEIGKNLFLLESKDGYEFDPEVNRQMETAEKVMNKFRNAIKELANR